MNQIVQNSDEKLLHDCLNSEVGLPYLNSVGGIKLRNLEVRNVGERVFSHPAPAMAAVQDEAAKHIDAVFVSKPTAVRKAKSSIDVTNFFSRADSLKQPEEGVSPPGTDIAGSAQPVAEKEKEKGKEKGKEKKKGEENEKEKDKEKKKERKHSDDGDEEEWEGEEEKPAKKGKAGADRHASKPSAAKPAPPRPDCSKEEQSKRENPQGQQEKEQAGQGQGEGEGQGEEQQEQEQEVSRSPAPPQQRRKRKEVLHGAMDDFMAEKEPPRGDGASIVAPSNRPPRGKRRRLVEKVSAWWWSRFRSLSALSPHM